MRSLSVLLVVLPSPAFALDFTVDDANDAPDVVCDGTCDANAGVLVECTLRAAIDEANCQAGADVVELTVSPVLMIGGAGEDANATGDLDVLCDSLGLAQDLTVRGMAFLVDGADLDRVFDLHCPDATVAFERLTIEDGDVVGAGGGIYARSRVDLSLAGVTVRSCQADNGAGVALDFEAVGTFEASTVEYNDASRSGGGIFGSSATLNLTHSTVAGNSADDGGGVFLSGDATIANSTLSRNLANDDGGGLYWRGGSYVTIKSSTVALNTALSQGGGVHSGAGAVALELIASILGENMGASGPDCAGTAAIDTSDSLVSNTAGCPLADLGGNALNVPSDLQGLAWNGGPTRTHLLGAASPALDVLAIGQPLDQRYMPRPAGGAYDMGATEQ